MHCMRDPLPTIIQISFMRCQQTHRIKFNLRTARGISISAAALLCGATHTRTNAHKRRRGPQPTICFICAAPMFLFEAPLTMHYGDECASTRLFFLKVHKFINSISITPAIQFESNTSGSFSNFNTK